MARMQSLGSLSASLRTWRVQLPRTRGAEKSLALIKGENGETEETPRADGAPWACQAMPRRETSTMSDQEEPAGWRVGVNDYDMNRNILRTTYYLVAIPDETAMIAAMYDQNKMNGGVIGYQKPIAAAVLKEYSVKENEIYEWKVVMPRGSEN